MPTHPIDHLRKAESNEALLDKLLTEQEYLDWAMTLCFYTALQYVDAYFAEKKRKPANHRHRNRLFEHDSVIQHLKPRYYDKLYNESVNARYECYEYSALDVKLAMQDWLQPFKLELVSLIDISSQDS